MLLLARESFLGKRLLLPVSVLDPQGLEMTCVLLDTRHACHGRAFDNEAEEVWGQFFPAQVLSSWYTVGKVEKARKTGPAQLLLSK